MASSNPERRCHMATYVILSRFSPEASRDPKDFKQLAHEQEEDENEEEEEEVEKGKGEEDEDEQEEEDLAITYKARLVFTNQSTRPPLVARQVDFLAAKAVGQ